MGVNATSGASSGTAVAAAYDVPLIDQIEFQREGLLGSGLAARR